VDGYSGDATDAMRMAENPDGNSNGMMFSTPDRDNDQWGAGHCGRTLGWWYRYCSVSNLNRYDSIWTIGTPVYDVQASRMLVKCN